MRTLLGPEDGIGDLTVTVARISPGRMQAHRHGAGGEVMFIPRGRGRLWVEGLPLQLVPGTAAVAPEGILHNAENTAAGPLIVVGCFSPAAVPGSYREEAPRFTPSGRLESAAALAVPSPWGRGGPDPEARAWGRATIVPRDARSPNVGMALLRLRPFESLSVSSAATARAWVAVSGRGSVVEPPGTAGRLQPFDLVALGAGTRLRVAADAAGLTLVEFETILTSVLDGGRVSAR